MWAILAHYDDGSGIPQVLRVYRTLARADSDMKMIAETSPMKHVFIQEVPEDQPEEDVTAWQKQS